MPASNVLRVWDPESGERGPLNLPMQVGGQPGGSAQVITTGAAQNPATTNADIVVAVFSVPAGAFASPGDTLTIEADGALANNTNTKTVKMIFGATGAVVGSAVSGGTTIASMTWATAGANQAWVMQAQVTKFGAAGSNTQVSADLQNQIGATNIALTTQQALTVNESAAILIALTINATTTVTDASFTKMVIEPVA